VCFISYSSGFSAPPVFSSGHCSTSHDKDDVKIELRA
jgi:hypothetical protein